ncbi:MAG: hypothetical protein QOI77_392 [Blastocatellia bacterium]|jgi:catechol 2,3-dioxygenase-like lactoylglutathione lyase family enzyme|nr:hypothetical protein [Blastocatellia bacterium]
MHPLRKLRESGKPTRAQVSELLADNIVFNSPLLVRPIEGREVIAAIFAQSSSTRGSGTYTAEFKLDERPTNAIRDNNANEPKVAAVDMKLEVIVIPVSDVDRAEKFYQRLGWRQDVTPPGSGVFQFTPHGSSCSIQFGKNLTSASPGSAQKTYLIVSDIQAVRDALVGAGIDVGEIFHLTPEGPVNGLDPERGTYRSRAVFSDPDGNS